MSSGRQSPLDRARQRFLSRVEPLPSGCWAWRGPLFGGAALFPLGGADVPAQVAAWRLFRGEPDALAPLGLGARVRPLCGNPACTNPEHLWMGTPTAYRRDVTPSGAAMSTVRGGAFCARGHPLPAGRYDRCPRCSPPVPARSPLRPSLDAYRGG